MGAEMVNRVSSWIEFPVLSETARDALVSLFTDVPETENGKGNFHHVIMRVVGVSDPDLFDDKKYFDRNWCEIEECDFANGYEKITLESAWAAPKIALAQLAIFIGRIDPNLIMTLNYEDEQYPTSFFGWATYLADGFDEHEEIEEDDYYDLACEFDPKVKKMKNGSAKYLAYMEENTADIISHYVRGKLEFEVNWTKENNYGRDG
jgi:hypothetical protein